MSNISDATESFYCSITHKLMIEPVTDPDGNNYEKDAIEGWIHQHSTSPITQKPLTINDLHPNLALKQAISEYRDSIQLDVDSASSTTTPSSSELMISRSRNNEFVHISIQPSQDEKRPLCDICCVVDTSGSMSTAAEIQNDKNEKYGLSQLDLVKHSLKTIINSLCDEDRLSLVSFDYNAKIILGLTKMDDAGKKNALEAVEKLRVGRLKFIASSSVF